MSEQPSTSRWPVVVATLFLLLSAGTFAVSFYALDGAQYLTPLLERALDAAGFTDPEVPTVPARPEVPADRVVMPEGMPEAFALRVWQEQMESQPMIERLVNGEVRALTIDSVDVKGDEARLQCTVRMTAGASAPGVIGLKRFGQDWYVASATSAAHIGKRQARKVPSADEVDVQLLNTVLKQTASSQQVINEYLDGIVSEVRVVRVRPGLRTATLDLEMVESHGNGYARLIAIRTDVEGEPRWVLARFTKTGDASRAK